NLPKTVEISERIGLCLYHAAMQAENSQEFRNFMIKALNTFDDAARLSKKIDSPFNLAKMHHYQAEARYISSRLEKDVVSRKKLLDECWKLEKKALRMYKEIDDRLGLGKTYNELNRCLADHLDLEWDTKSRQEMLREALDNSIKAIDILSKLGEDHELARAYYTACNHYHTITKGLDLKKRSKYEREALSHSKKVLELSEKIGDYCLLGLASICRGSTITNFSNHPNSAIKCFKEALKYGKLTRDKYLIGRASYLLAHLMAWKIIAEEDPEKIREESKKCEEYIKDAIRNFTSISNDQEIASCYYWYAENYISLARSTETNPRKKRILLRKSIKLGKKGLEHAQRSGSIGATWFILHPLSKSLYYSSIIETDKDAKKKLLQESLQYRLENIRTLKQAMPYYFWNHGVYHNYLALIQAELAEIEDEKNQKVQLLEDGIESAKNSITLCLRTRTLSRGQHATLGKYYSDFGRILIRLHLITSSDEILNQLLEVFKGAVNSYKKANLPSRTAESYWQLARVQSKLLNYEKAAENFEKAQEQYIVAAENTPSLKRFYLDHACYMSGWSEIETAKRHHAKQEYRSAKKHYEKAARLHKSTESWRYLVPNYLAWAKLEHGENLSRREQTEKAREIFQNAARLFKEAKRSMKNKLKSIEIGEEKKMSVELVKLSDIRREYCYGRVALEEGKLLERKSEYIASSQKYGSAARVFEKAMDAMEHEFDRHELRPIIYLCKAWQTMTQAEAEASPHLYLQASKLFDEAKEYSINEEARLLALGHSCFCKALEAGRRFEATRAAELHLAATQHLEGAANYYIKAGYKTASEYARATQRLLDAHMYIHKATTEINPIAKSQYYKISERLLQATANSYMKAKKPEKSKGIKRLIENVKEEQELALSLTEVLQAPTIMSTTTSFSTPTPTHEKAVGLERFEHENIQADLNLNTEEAKIGEDFNLDVQLANVGKETVLLHRIEGIVPEGFELVSKPDYCRLKDRYLDLKGKRLDPLKVEEIKLVLRSFNKGSSKIDPKISYIDETGNQASLGFEPVEISVLEVILPERITTGYSDLDSLLFGGLPEGYSVILTSPSCDEKDMLTRRFLKSGVEDKQVTFFITIGAGGVEALAEKFQSNFSIFFCNPQIDPKLRDLPNVFRLKGVENLTEINIALTSAFRRLDKSKSGSKKACIDIISDVLLQHHSVSTRRWLAGLLPDLRSRGFTTLAVMNPHMHPLQEVQAILDLFEGEINIYEKKTEKGPERFLRIKRMIDQEYLESELLLRKKKLT
ncbi:MAG: ATPase domain-containing protein, partial [Candidatus Bathyarchaeota archaeon]